MEQAVFATAIQTPDTLAAIRAVAPSALTGSVPNTRRATYLNAKEGRPAPPTLGQWGSLS